MDPQPDVGALPPLPQLRGNSNADRAVNLALDVGELWHAPDGTPWYTETLDRRESVPVKSPAFRERLSALYWRASAGATTLNSTAARQATDTLAGASRDEPEYTPAVRVAALSGVVFLDHADPARNVTVISGGSWRVASGGQGLPDSIRFHRTDRVVQLPLASSGGTLDTLREFVHVDDDGWALARAWLLNTLRPEAPYPVLAFMGEHRTGKTTSARALRDLVDPQAIDEGSAPGQRADTRAVVLAAKHGRVLFLGNLSRVDGELSDVLCAIATGGGMSTRTLYTDDSETIVKVARPVMLTGIGHYIGRPDLLDRTLVVEPPVFEAQARRPERELWAAYRRAQPAMLGALLSSVAAALEHGPADLGAEADSVRMLDVAEFVEAAEQHGGAALGTGERFVSVAASQAEAQALALVDSDPVLRALGQLMKRKELDELNATPGDLADLLAPYLGEPITPAKLGQALKRLAPVMRAVGWAVEQRRSGAARGWRLTAPS